MSDQLYEMSLEDLLSVAVVTGRSQTVLNAPGVVSTLSVDELSHMGVNDLKEILAFLPGVAVNEAAIGNSPIQIRGLSDSFNQKVLFLLNGVPYWMPAHGDIPLNGIPLNGIEKVEVIRGPGSMRYGTNASAGVINIITRPSTQGGRIALGLGSKSLAQGSLSIGGSINDIDIQASLATQREDGYDASVYNGHNVFDPGCVCFPSNLDGQFERFLEYDQGMITVSSGALKLTLQAHESTNSNLPDLSPLNVGMREESGLFFAGEYLWQVEQTEINTFLDYNRFSQKILSDNIGALFPLPGGGEISFDHNGEGNYRYRVGVHARHDMTESFGLELGFEHEYRATEKYSYRFYEDPFALVGFGFTLEDDGSVLLIDENDQTESSVFTQIAFQKNNWHAYAGARFVDNSIFGSHVAPNLSVVYQWDDTQSIKAVFSEGFNSPTFRQNSSPDILGNLTNANIQPEVVQSWDLAYTFSNKHYHFVANVYRVDAKDLIVSGAGGTRNEGEVRRTGFELDSQYRKDRWTLMASAAYLKEGNSQSHSDPSAYFASRWLLRSGVSYGIHNDRYQHDWGSSVYYSSSRGGVSSASYATISYTVEKGPYQLKTTFSKSLSGEILQPDVRTGDPLVFEARPENQVWLELSIGF